MTSWQRSCLRRVLQDSFFLLPPATLCVLSHFGRVQLCATLQTVACQAPLSVGFSRQEYRSGLLCPSPGDLPHPGVEPLSLMYPALAGWFFTTSAIWEAHCLHGFHFTRMSYSWNYTEYRLFKLTSFTCEYAFKIFPCLLMT